MKNNKIIFTIPTLFTRPELVFECVQHLYNQCEKSNLDYKIVLISNTNDENFNSWETGDENVIKMVSDSQYGISKALNMVIDTISDEDYFVFIHDDMFILDDDWIQKFIDIYNTEDLKCGVLGVRPHSHREKYCVPVKNNVHYQMDELLWTDGVMFMSTDIFNEVGIFDESYFGDRECQDFSYKVFDVGYKNYMIYVNRDHRSIPFDHKVGGDVDNFKDKVQKSYEIYNEKWANWENNKIMEIGYQC